MLPEDIAKIPEILAAPDSVEVMDGTDAGGRRILLFSKQIGDRYYTAQAVTDGRHALTTDTLWIKKGKPTDTMPNASVSADPVHNAQSAPPSGFPLDPIIPTLGDGVNMEYAQPGGEDILIQTAPEMASEERLRQLIQQEAIRRTMLDVDEETEARLTQAAKEMYGADQTQKTAPVQGAESTYIDTDPATHTLEQMQKIREYQKATDNVILAFIKRWAGLKDPNYRKKVRIPIAEVTARAVADIKAIVGVDTSGYEHALSGGALEHIKLRHGAQGKADHSMANPNDIARMGYVLENYDSVSPLLNEDGTQRVSREYKNTDQTPAPLIQFSKRIDGTYYVVEAVPDSAARQLRVVSAYLSKDNGSTDQLLNMPQGGPQLTPKTLNGADTSIDSIIPSVGDGVNIEYAPGGGMDILKETALQMSAGSKKPLWQKRNMETIRRAASTFGPVGAQKLQEFYQGSSQAPEEYFGGFAVYYHAGLTGQDIMTVQGDHADAINYAQAEAAYLAGQLDASGAADTQKSVEIPGEKGYTVLEKQSEEGTGDGAYGAEEQAAERQIYRRPEDTGGVKGADRSVEEVSVRKKAAHTNRTYQYRRVAGVQGESISERFRAWGIEADVVDGDVTVEKDGITRQWKVRDAITVEGGLVLINKDTAVGIENVLGHEAYHVWKEKTARDVYTEFLRDNIDFSSSAFQEYQDKIAMEYFGGEVDLFDRAKLEGFEEELFAYISGQLNDGGYESTLRAILRDYDGAKSAWEALVEVQKSEVLKAKAVEAEKDYGIAQETYLSLKSRAEKVQGLKGLDGKVIPKSEGLLLMQMVYDTPGLTEKQRKALFEYLGVEKSVRHYNKAAVAEVLERMRKRNK